ncbi:anthranilate synthase component I family protein [Nannocystis pusilla]|uniref:Anthranilate synthase component I family protein n=1 Tax=Nannocystis pusilla TaxID=889268 RepID=A0A9X3IVC3_9BACT|nr:anthranilate synthase component I family protein [Nannocystis pusilla]MCY1005246.1 anthranilate synthase component I family protein [Nannocystis pusilla]
MIAGPPLIEPASPRLVPVWRELLCDGITPVEVYARLRAYARGGGSGPPDLPGVSFLLESAGGAGERWARYSVVGVGARAHVRGVWNGYDLDVTITPGPGFSLPPGVENKSRGLAGIAALQRAYESPPRPDLPRFWGGLVGVWGHDAARVFDPIPAVPGLSVMSSDLPAVELVASDTLVVFDNFSNRVRVLATACAESEGGAEAAEAAARARVDAVARALHGPSVLGPRRVPDVAPPATEVAAPWSREKYRASIAAAREHIMAGDIFQVVLSQRFVSRRDGVDLLDVYRMLRVGNPAPYMYLFDLPAAALTGASPEVLVRCDRDALAPAVTGASSSEVAPQSGLRVTVRPIAGTRRRGVDAVEDEALASELLADPKERAEHLMLVDLGRNDLGRVSVAGSVRVSESFSIERYSRVMHIVSEVQGELRPELTALDALRATFPAGTLSGAPKIRALQIIDALEPAPRGWYGGAVGYLGYDGGADFAICIRSLVAVGDEFRVQAGAGVVYDSSPEGEDNECHVKASAVLRAIAAAAEGGAA